MLRLQSPQLPPNISRSPRTWNDRIHQERLCSGTASAFVTGRRAYSTSIRKCWMGRLPPQAVGGLAAASAKRIAYLSTYVPPQVAMPEMQLDDRKQRAASIQKGSCRLAVGERRAHLAQGSVRVPAFRHKKGGRVLGRIPAWKPTSSHWTREPEGQTRHRRATAAEDTVFARQIVFW